MGISILTPTALRGYEIAKEFRSKRIPVVLSGVQASLCLDEASGYCDSVVVGEVEELREQVMNPSGSPLKVLSGFSHDQSISNRRLLHTRLLPG